MNPSILHIVRKDLLRLRYLVALWFVVLIADCLCESGVITLTTLNDTETALRFLTLIKNLAAFMLVAFLVQEDNLVDTNAFWLTRPISGSRLFLAKTCFAGVFVVFPPIMAESVAILLNNGTLGQAVLGAAPLLVDMLMLTVATGLLASFASTFGQLVAAVFFLIVGAGFLSARGNDSNALARWFHQFGYLNEDTHRILSAALISDVWIVIFGAIILHAQFRTRATVRSVAATVLAFFLCISINDLWTRDFLSPRLGAAVDYAEGTPEIIHPESIRTVDESGYGYRPENTRTRVLGSIVVSNLKRGYQAVSRITSSRHEPFEFEESDDLGRLEQDILNRPDPHALSGILRGRYVSDDDYSAGQTLEVLGAQDLQNSKDRTLQYQAMINTEIFQYRKVGVLPLDTDAFTSPGSAHISIRHIRRVGNSVHIDLDIRYLDVIYDRGDVRRRAPWGRAPWYAFVLRNRKNNELLLPQMTGGGGWTRYNSDRSVRRSSHTLMFRYPHYTYQEWLGDAELIVVDAILVDRLSRKVNWRLRIPDSHQTWFGEELP
jgi:hypothetical protein